MSVYERDPWFLDHFNPLTKRPAVDELDNFPGVDWTLDAVANDDVDDDDDKEDDALCPLK